MIMPKDLSSFVAIDFEKMNSNQTSVCEVGMVKYKDGQEIERFHSLIRPAKGLVWGEKYRSLLPHIKEEELLKAPTFRNLHSNMCQFVGKDILICHNAAADMNYIFYCEREAGVKISLCKSGYIDTQEMAKQILGPENKGLFLCYRSLLHKDPVNHHCAVDDASSCAEVFCAFQQLRDWRKFYHIEKYKPSKDKHWDDREYDGKIVFVENRTTDTNHVLSYQDEVLLTYNFQGKRVIVTSTGKQIKNHICTNLLPKLGATNQGEKVNSRTDALIVGENGEGWRKLDDALVQKEMRPDSFYMFSAKAFLNLYDKAYEADNCEKLQIIDVPVNDKPLKDNIKEESVVEEEQHTTHINWSEVWSGIVAVLVLIVKGITFVCGLAICVVFWLIGIPVKPR